jgi:hypothetical protein
MVIRWTFLPAALAALVFLAFAYAERRSECATKCRELGAPAWELRLNSGGRFNLGTHCVCEKAR